MPKNKAQILGEATKRLSVLQRTDKTNEKIKNNYTDALELIVDNLNVLNDYSLIQKALEGTESAYTELMNRYKESVYFVTLKMVNNNNDDTEDLTIEAFGKAFNKLHKYNPEYAFSTWLFRIAINNSIDFIRKKKLHTLSIDHPIDGLDDEYLKPSIASSDLNPENSFIKEQRIELIHTITNQLSPKYRQLIELRFFKEYSYEEIAEEMELPIGSVKAQLFRAKQLLHNILDKTGNNF